MGRTYALNPGGDRYYVMENSGVRGVTQEELEMLAGHGSGRRKAKRNSVNSNAGGKSMAKRKTKRKKSTKRKSAKRKTSKRKSPRRKSAKRKSPKRKSVKRKSPKRKSVKRRRKVSRRRKRRTRRNPAVAANPKRRKRRTRRNPAVAANPKRRKRRSRRARRNPAVAANPRKRSRRRSRRRSIMPAARRMRFNTMFRVRPNDWPGHIPEHRTAAGLGWKRRRRPTKNYKKAKQVRGRYPITRNPQSVVSAFTSNLKSVTQPAVLMTAFQVTIGSVATPLASAYVATAIGKIVKRDIPIGGFMGIGVQALTMSGLAFIAKSLKQGQLGKNIILGGTSGIASDLAKRYIVPRVLSMIAPAAAAVISTEAAAPTGVSGLYNDVSYDARHGGGMGAYATVSEIENF